ncbi:MAG: hypothetical protein HQM15_05125 [Deltaproteobacteria bacterium]|nr:hypothetical protein [Deltaproteobacteria bacterium]
MLKKITLIFLFLSSCSGPSIFTSIPLSTSSPTLAKPISMSIDETNARAYVVNSNYTFMYQDASLLVLDLSNPIAPGTRNAVSIKNYSGQSYLDATNHRLYVTNRLSTDVNDTVDQILRINVNETDSHFLQVDEFNADVNPFGIIGDGTNLYTVCQNSLDRYLLSDLTHRTRIDFQNTLSAGQTYLTTDTREAAIAPDSAHIFVSNRSDKLLILNTSDILTPDPSQEVTAPGGEAMDYALTSTSSTRGIASDGTYIYVVEASPPALKILTDRNLGPVVGAPIETSLASLAVAEIPLAPDPNEVAVDVINHRAYVSLSQDHQISVIDTQLFREIARISVRDNLPSGVKSGEYPFALSVGHFGGTAYVYVMNLNTNTISIINGTTLAIVASYP